MVQVHNTSTPA